MKQPATLRLKSSIQVTPEVTPEKSHIVLHRSGDPNASREEALPFRRWPWQSADSVC